MFKKVSIYLTEPICDCGTGNIAWGITVSKQPELHVFCKICKVTLKVPHKEFLADIEYESKVRQPVPKPSSPPPVERKPRVIDDGKLFHVIVKETTDKN